MSKRILTISREFGSAGHTIARLCAEELQLPIYDKELVRRIADETGFDPKFVDERAEHAPSKGIFAYAFGQTGVPGVMDGLSASDYLYKTQREVILSIAEKEPCVIVGRCSDYILRDREDTLHAYIHASPEFRAERIVRVYGESDVPPLKRLEDKDKKRRVNYKHFTDREWGMSQNYHISLDSGVLGVENCVRIITDLYRNL